MTKQKLGPNQRKWLKALESGKFKQTRIGALKAVSGGYCCLGVACELFKPKSMTPKVSPSSSRKIIFGSDSNFAPRFVVSALGLWGDNGAAKDDDGGKSLATLNDKGTRFPRLAAMVRANPGAYFKRTK